MVSIRQRHRGFPPDDRVQRGYLRRHQNGKKHGGAAFDSSLLIQRFFDRPSVATCSCPYGGRTKGCCCPSSMQEGTSGTKKSPATRRTRSKQDSPPPQASSAGAAGSHLEAGHLLSGRKGRPFPREGGGEPLLRTEEGVHPVLRQVGMSACMHSSTALYHLFHKRELINHVHTYDTI